MRIVVSDFISLDGVVQAPGGPEEDIDGGFRHGGWSMPYFDPDTMGPAVGEIIVTTEALLFGRRTWQAMAAAWPDRAGDPFADRMNEIPKYVVRELRARDGEALQVMGSASLAAQLIARGLVDEYRLVIEPILLGGGKRLFPDDSSAHPLDLVSATTAATGVLICTYRPADR
jgi:dihydrofolate reductase